VRGSGPGGRIVKRDVERALADQPSAAPPPVADESDGSESNRPSGAGKETTMSRMRRTIASRMEKAKRDIPHFYIRTDVDADELVRLHETLRADEVIPGVTVTHLLLMAIARTLPAHPRLNALWVEDNIELIDDVNIGIVVALDDGLLVPVLKRAQDLGLKELVGQSRALVERTRQGKFRGDDLVGGSISVSNIGMLDVDELTPIINAPQASILGVGSTRECAVVRGGEVRAGHVMTLTLACDHRVVNGVEAGRFLQDLKHCLERPLALVVES
jgi:pyruvate dehydrogenase E2 component (dihydrolipoamide acetyltransferase)